LVESRYIPAPYVAATAPEQDHKELQPNPGLS